MATAQEHIENYIDLRDQMNHIRKEADRKIAAIKEELLKIENGLMKNVFDAQGTNSFGTKTGRAHVQTKQRFYPDDRDIFTGFILEAPQERIGLLELRPLQKACKEYAEEFDDVPDGIAVFSERKVIITKV